MMVTVVLDSSRERLELAARSTVRDAAVRTGLSPEECVASLNGEIVPDDEPLSQSDKIEFFRVVSGG